MNRILSALIMSVVLLSCTSHLDKEFNEKTAEEDLQKIKEELDSTELILLAGSILRLKFQNKKLEKMTYKQILNNGKTWKAEQERIEEEKKEIAKEAKKKEDEKIDKLSKSVIVSCFEKGFSKYNYEDYITYKFVIQNKSDKEIRAVKGEVEFTNLFGDKIKSFGFVHDQPIQANKQVTWSASTDYNQFNDEDQALKNKDLKDLKLIWEPEKIIFSDGSTLE